LVVIGLEVERTMESHLSEDALWAKGLASRLRLIQANSMDDPPAARHGYLTDEIERALKTVAPSRRKEHLDALAERFPAWEGVRSASHSDAEVGNTPLTPEQLVGNTPLTPEQLVASLVEIAPTLSPEARTSFADQLHAVGLAAKEASNPWQDIPPELQKKLGLPAGKPLQSERAVKLLGIVVELSLTLDQLAWTLWRQLAPKSAIRKEADLNRLTGAYLAGDNEVSTSQLTQAIEKSRRLIAGLLGAVGRAGSTYAKTYVSRLSPEVIEDFAKMEKKFIETIEGACWRKFVQQSKAHASEAAIENEIQEAIAKAAENLILGRSAG
jgi:hypothetical protein